MESQTDLTAMEEKYRVIHIVQKSEKYRVIDRYVYITGIPIYLYIGR